MSSRPRFGRPQDELVWKGVCESEKRMVESISKTRPTAQEVPSYIGPLDRQPLPRGSTMRSDTGQVVSAPGAPQSTTSTSALVPSSEVRGNTTSNEVYGWSVTKGTDTRGAPATYHGLKKSNFFS